MKYYRLAGIDFCKAVFFGRYCFYVRCETINFYLTAVGRQAATDHRAFIMALYKPIANGINFAKGFCKQRLLLKTVRYDSDQKACKIDRFCTNKLCKLNLLGYYNDIQNYILKSKCYVKF
jgi:hypothetical protein